MHGIREHEAPMLDLSVIAPLRNAEASAGELVRAAVDVIPRLGGTGQLGKPVRFEILVVDERSVDNTLAMVSLLHAQIPELRALQDVTPGLAIAAATRAVQGRIWVILDHAPPTGLLTWAVQQVARGHRAAVVPGEVLAVERTLGLEALRDLEGGLVRAQAAVTRVLRQRDEHPAYSPAPRRGLLDRAVLRLRERASGPGLARLDRPWGGSLRGLL
jgi:glycosyltransferase involved in cell wall biosynthesis